MILRRWACLWLLPIFVWIISRAVPMVWCARSYCTTAWRYECVNVDCKKKWKKSKRAFYTCNCSYVISMEIFDLEMLSVCTLHVSFLMAFPPHFHSRFWQYCFTYSLYNISSFVSVQICDRSYSSPSLSMSGQLHIDCTMTMCIIVYGLDDNIEIWNFLLTVLRLYG